MQRLRNLTVQRKLLGGFAVAVAVFGAMTTFTLLKMSDINQNLVSTRTDDHRYTQVVQARVDPESGTGPSGLGGA
jgi:CHASE3 domain sensor protein